MVRNADQSGQVNPKGGASLDELLSLKENEKFKKFKNLYDESVAIINDKYKKNEGRVNENNQYIVEIPTESGLLEFTYKNYTALDKSIVSNLILCLGRKTKQGYGHLDPVLWLFVNKTLVDAGNYGDGVTVSVYKKGAWEDFIEGEYKKLTSNSAVKSN